jgi:hypothetical protein
MSGSSAGKVGFVGDSQHSSAPTKHTTARAHAGLGALQIIFVQIVLMILVTVARSRLRAGKVVADASIVRTLHGSPFGLELLQRFGLHAVALLILERPLPWSMAVGAECFGPAT